MLKITVTETPGERRWVVQGRLIGPWVSELRATWRRWGRRDKRTCIIDLKDVAFIDKSGERLLRAMSKKGAQLIASGVYTRHFVERLKNSWISPAVRTGRNASADRLARTEEQ